VGNYEHVDVYMACCPLHTRILVEFLQPCCQAVKMWR